MGSRTELCSQAVVTTRLDEALSVMTKEHDCDRALQSTVAVLECEWVIGIGRFAETQAKRALAGTRVKIARILHPSPASPAANRGWAEQAERELDALGLLQLVG